MQNSLLALAVTGIAVAFSAQWLTGVSHFETFRPRCPSAEPAVFFSRRVVLAGAGAAEPGFLHVLRSGLLGAAQRGSREEAAEYASLHGAMFRDMGNNCISPGLVDVHAHISALGDRGFEGFASASEAAAAGGVTTMVQMPLNSVPATTSVSALEMEVAAFAASPRVFSDVGLWAGVVPGSSGQALQVVPDPSPDLPWRAMMFLVQAQCST